MKPTQRPTEQLVWLEAYSPKSQHSMSARGHWLFVPIPSLLFAFLIVMETRVRVECACLTLKTSFSVSLCEYLCACDNGKWTSHA